MVYSAEQPLDLNSDYREARLDKGGCYLRIRGSLPSTWS